VTLFFRYRVLSIPTELYPPNGTKFR
jgi:hypothetical protein